MSALVGKSATCSLGVRTIQERFAAAHEDLRTAAVTGTNGKTTTTSMIEAIVAASGQPYARLTTLGGFVCGQQVEAASPTEEYLRTVEGAVQAGGADSGAGGDVKGPCRWFRSTVATARGGLYQPVARSPRHAQER